MIAFCSAIVYVLKATPFKLCTSRADSNACRRPRATLRRAGTHRVLSRSEMRNLLHVTLIAKFMSRRNMIRVNCLMKRDGSVMGDVRGGGS